MESLTRTIDEAIQSKDYARLAALFDGGSANSSGGDGSGSGSGGGGTASWHQVGQGEKRSLAAYFLQSAATVESGGGFLPEAFKEIEHVFVTALGHLPSTVDGAADNKIRQMLFEYKCNESDDEDYVGAARILAGIRIDPEDDPSNVYYMTPLQKMDVHVKIAECFLSEEEIAEADAAVNKAGAVAPLVSAAANNTSNENQKQQALALLLRYKSTYARVLDHNRKFLQASQRYHELSQQHELIDEDEQLQLLGRAVTCVLLAPSGPQRQRVLRNLYQDERLHKLDALDEFATHSALLSQTYHHQIVPPSALVLFESNLRDHQKATMGDGLTILERGIVEHNMTAVSHLYSTMYVSELANVLGVNPRKAEKIAASMIMDGTIHGKMDQVDGLLTFDVPESQDQAADRAITAFCVELNAIANSLRSSSSPAS